MQVRNATVEKTKGCEMGAAVKSGVSAGAVRRPLGETKVTCGRATQVQIKESSVVK